jgi:predicted ATPase
MLLSRLFGQILGHGCMVCFTSNRPARDLYKGGLSRKYSEPFIQLIDERLLQLKVAGGRDYRAQHAVQHALQQQSKAPRASQQQLARNRETGSQIDTMLAAAAAGAGAWWVGQGGEQQLQQHWQQLARHLALLHAAVGAAAESSTASIQLPFGRKLWIPQALLSLVGGNPAGLQNCRNADSASSDDAGQQQQQQQQQQHGQLEAALFTFEQLCGNGGSRRSLEHAGAMSANDYVALVRACPVLFVSALPQLQPQQRDEARRLVTFVDVA